MRSKFYSYLMSLGHVTADMNQGALSAILPYLIVAYNYDFATAGSIVMFYSVVGSVVQPVFGQLADKHFNLWVMPISLLLACGGMACTGITSNYWTLCAAAMLSGIGVSMFHPIAALILNRTAPTGRLGECLSIFSFGGNMGFVIGPLLAGTLVSLFDLKGTLILLIPALITNTVIWFKHKEIIAIMGEKPGEKKAVKETKGEDNWKAFGILTLGVLSRSVLFFALNTYILLYWIYEFGQTKAYSSTLLSCFFACSAMSTLVGGRFADKYGYRKILRISYFLMLPSLIAFCLSNNMYLSTIILIPMGLAPSLGYSSNVALGQLFLPNHLGLASGISLGLSVSMGGVVLPLLGKIADIYGLKMVFVALIAVCLLAICSAMMVPDAKKNLQTQN